MSTLESLQDLKDGPFHRICDDLLRRHEPELRRLRTHGLNQQSDSIVGQPDSYVGATAATCQIAVCYTTQKAGWWRKLVDDVKEAVSASPGVEQIYLAIPWSIDRDGPKEDKDKWLTDAKAAAGKAQLHTYHGPEIAQLLDSDYQDIRFQHLGIPYSRLSRQSMLASCKLANDTIVSTLAAAGRFDPNRYLYREADKQLGLIWQRSWVSRSERTEKDDAVQMVALVNDSGVGKTSLLASFVASTPLACPILLIQSWQVSFDSDDGLIRAVIRTLQGVLSPELQREEEAAIVHLLAPHTPLTVVLDGIDESGDPEALKRAITAWLRSRLGRNSLLVVSSRPEFWRASVDRTWVGLVSKGRYKDREPSSVQERRGFTNQDPFEGLKLPSEFSTEELEQAWIRASLPKKALHALPEEVREELRHPFTLRAYADLYNLPGGEELRTRAQIIEAWLARRLSLEERPTERITTHLYVEALSKVAQYVQQGRRGWISVDEIRDVPRFNPVRPPGPVVEALLGAGILESLRDYPDRVRFTSEAVQDFFLAKTDAEKVRSAPDDTAEELLSGTFSSVQVRLSRIGESISNVPVRNQFLRALCEKDPIRAAVVLSRDPMAYQGELRKKVVAGLIPATADRLRARASFAIGVLGGLACEESGRALVDALQAIPTRPYHVRYAASQALTRLSYVPGVPYVYDSPSFDPRTDHAYYFRDNIEHLRRSSEAFQKALSAYAAERLSVESGTDEHYRAVSVMAHVADNSLADHIKERLEHNGVLQEYENHALIALGTENAAVVYVASIKEAAKRHSGMDYKDGGFKRYASHTSVVPNTYDLRYLLTSAFERALAPLVQDPDDEIRKLLRAIARGAQSRTLLHLTLIDDSTRTRKFLMLGGQTVDYVDPSTWVSWWRSAPSEAAKEQLLQSISPIPTGEIEDILNECLEYPRLRTPAASLIGRMGFRTLAARLRQLLQEMLPLPNEPRGWLNAMEVIRSLGELSDIGSVSLLSGLLDQARGDLLRAIAIALGAIGTPDSEQALTTALERGLNAEAMVAGLIMHGSKSAVGRSVQEAKKRGDGPIWLAKRVPEAFFSRAWYAGEYHTHVHDEELSQYLEDNEHAFSGKQLRDLVHVAEHVDSPNVRRLLTRLAKRLRSSKEDVASDGDEIQVSKHAYRELLLRGDPNAVEYHVREAIALGHPKSWIAEELGQCPRDMIARHLMESFETAVEDKERIGIIELLGVFGPPESAEQVKRQIDSPNEELANAAYEAYLRLTDPLLLPAHWS